MKYRIHVLTTYQNGDQREIIGNFIRKLKKSPRHLKIRQTGREVGIAREFLMEDFFS